MFVWRTYFRRQRKETAALKSCATGPIKRCPKLHHLAVNRYIESAIHCATTGISSSRRSLVQRAVSRNHCCHGSSLTSRLMDWVNGWRRLRVNWRIIRWNHLWQRRRFKWRSSRYVLWRRFFSLEDFWTC